MVAFGLVFIGLEIMKDSMKEISHSIDLSQYQGYNILWYVLLGAVITIVIQSSSATTAITLTAIASGIISYNVALALVIGANI